MRHVTFYTSNIDPQIVQKQKEVFERFGREIEQVYIHDWRTHGHAINTFLVESLENGKYGSIAIWDIDCIPLSGKIFDIAISETGTTGRKIFGIAQRASHIKNSIMYCGPSFICFELSTWEKLGRPTFECTPRSDCAGEVTHACIEKGVQVSMLYPKSCERPLWQLDGKIMFGKGTTYGDDLVYHAFLSRKDNTEMFLKKCEQVLQLNPICDRM